MCKLYFFSPLHLQMKETTLKIGIRGACPNGLGREAAEAETHTFSPPRHTPRGRCDTLHRRHECAFPSDPVSLSWEFMPKVEPPTQGITCLHGRSPKDCRH